MRRPLRCLSLLTCAMLGLSCGRSDATVDDAKVGVFELALVDTGPLLDRSQAEARCDDLPFFSRYELNGSDWTSLDSALGPCEAGAQREVLTVASTETFRLRGDSIDFFVGDSRIGENGLVLRGLLRLDTLLIWTTDLDGGEYRYIRRPLAR